MCCLTCLFYSHSGTSWHHYTFIGGLFHGFERIEWFEMRVLWDEGHTGRLKESPTLGGAWGAQRAKPPVANLK